MPSSRGATPSAAAAADRAKAADDTALRAERNARAEKVAMDKARAALAAKKEQERDELEEAKKLMRPAWNHSTRLGFQFDLSMEDGSDTDSDDGGRRRNSKMLTEDEVHNIRKFLNDEDDARAAESHLYDRWEDIDPEERAMRSDAFWGRWMVCTPPDYSTREDGGQAAVVQKDQQQMQMEEWQKMQGQPLDSPRRLTPLLGATPRSNAPSEDPETVGAAEMKGLGGLTGQADLSTALQQKNTLIKKWNGTLRGSGGAGSSALEGEEGDGPGGIGALPRPYCVECGKMEPIKGSLGGGGNTFGVRKRKSGSGDQVLLRCIDCDFVYCRDCWNPVHRYGSMRGHEATRTLPSNQNPAESRADTKSLMRALRLPPEEKTGLAGKSEFFERMHAVMQENGRADDTEDVEMPYGDKTLVVRLGVDYPLTARGSYVRAAEGANFLPEPSLVRRGTGRCFNKAHFGLGAVRMRALHAYLSELPVGVEEVDLTDNRLDDDATAAVVDCLKNNKELYRVKLGRNRIGPKAAKALAAYVSMDSCQLTELDLSQSGINATTLGMLCRGILKRGGACTLEKLNLSENRIRGRMRGSPDKNKGGLGGRVDKSFEEPVTGPLEHVVALLKHRGCGIAELSLAGNPLGDGGGQTIARAVRKNTSLTHLDLSMAGLDNRAAAALGDALKHNKGLQSLDVSYNRYGDRGALALATGVKRNATLTNIDASHTHISSKGVRNLLSAIEKSSGDGAALARNVRLDGTDLGLKRFQEFDVENPGGKYFLDLANTYERAILMQLIGSSKQHRNMKWKGPKKGRPAINDNAVSEKILDSMHKGRWKPPRTGVLEITIELTGKRAMPAAEEREVIFKRVQDTVRTTKGTEKLAMLGKLCNSEDLHIDLAAAQGLLSMFNTKQRGTALLSLLPCLLNHKDAITLATKNLTKKDQVQLDNSIGLVFGFSPLNPTGRYRLDLTDFYQRLVAIRCLQISNDEAKLCRRSGAGDTSQHGNYSAFRNELIAGRPLVVTTDHVFPPYRTLQFDFVSTKRAPAGTQQMKSVAFKRFLSAIGLKGRGGAVSAMKAMLAAKGAAGKWRKKAAKNKGSINRPQPLVSPQALMAQRAKEKVEETESNATTMRGLVYTSDGRIVRRGVGLNQQDGLVLKLRSYIVENDTWFTTDNLLSLIKKLPPQPDGGSAAGGGNSGAGESSRNIYALRIEVIMAVYARLIDHEDFNVKVFRSLSNEEQDELVHRIGWLKLFDPYNPEGLYKLRLEEQEDRRMAMLLLHVCAHEEAFYWKDVTMNAVPFTSIPHAWSKGLPHAGRLMLTIGKDPNVESEYESDLSSEEGEQSVTMPEEAGAAATNIDKYAVTGGLHSSHDIGGKFAARLRTPGSESQQIGANAGNTAKDRAAAAGKGGILKTRIKKPNTPSRPPTAVSISSEEPETIVIGGRVMVGHRKTAGGAKSASTISGPKKPRPKSRAKTPVIQPKRRRRLSMLTRKHIMPNVLSGALKIQKKYVAKKAAKKEEKSLNGGIRPLDSRFSSSSDESSSSEEDEEEVMSLLQIERPTEEAEEEVEEGFSPDDTVFASRIDTCDSESFYDDVVLTDMLEMDWERAIQDQPKVKMSLLKKHKKGFLCDAIPENIDEFYHELLDVFRKYRAHIYNSFDFYAVMGNGTDTGQIQMNQYSDWLDDCNITEPNNVPQCNRGALDRLFILVNREDDQEESTADANDDRALMRFEFLEIILRIAAAKYIDTRKSQDLIASTRKLLEEHILPNKGEGSCNALIDDPTQFRKMYVYTEPVDKELRKHLTLFQQMFGAYCRNGSVGMNIREWLAMLKDLEFLNYDFTNREAKLAFVWAKSRVIDEVKSREKIHRMTFYDFMEGLLRVAQLKPLPVVPGDLDRLVMTKALKEPTLRHWLTLSVSKKAKKALKVVERRSSEWGAPQTRKHHIKLRILVRLIKVSCDPRTGRSELFQLEAEGVKK